MRRWTLLEIRTKIENDLDLDGETFIEPAELIDIINEGIDDCEAQIHKLNREDEYFLARGTINLVAGTSKYALPSDIYANKLLSLTYVEGQTIYPVRRIRGLNRFDDIEAINSQNTQDDYRYVIDHSVVADGYRIELVPASRVTLSNGLRLRYIRNANRLEVDTDVCDIPEFVYYVIAFAKVQVYYKEGSPNLPDAKMELQRQLESLQATLAEMVPDDDNELIKDSSHYEASS